MAPIGTLLGRIFWFGVLFFLAFLIFDSATLVVVVMFALGALHHFSSRWMRNRGL